MFSFSFLCFQFTEQKGLVDFSLKLAFQEILQAQLRLNNLSLIPSALRMRRRRLVGHLVGFVKGEGGADTLSDRSLRPTPDNKGGTLQVSAVVTLSSLFFSPPPKMGFRERWVSGLKGQ